MNHAQALRLKTSAALVAGTGLLVWILAAGAIVSSAAPLLSAEGSRYQACISMAGRAPERALDEAFEWQHAGGGVPARHCAALALVELRRYERAAGQLEDIASEIVVTGGEAGSAVVLDDRMRADILAQAGNAWLLAGKPGKAYLVLSDALIDVVLWSVEEAELRVDRARSLAAVGDFESAIADLDRAASIVPGNADIYTFRASAKRTLENFDDARLDVERALEISPENIFALLERGNLRRLAGDGDGARQDWLKILNRAPGTPAADAAKLNIQRLDIGPEDGEAPGTQISPLPIPPLLLDPAPRTDGGS